MVDQLQSMVSGSTGHTASTDFQADKKGPAELSRGDRARHKIASSAANRGSGKSEEFIPFEEEELEKF